VIRPHEEGNLAGILLLYFETVGGVFRDRLQEVSI
jgi:hypothetical protein